MELYLLKSAAILAILYTFYKVFLENTSIHNFKRFYLFGNLLASFLIPFITFTTYVEVSPILPIYIESAPQIICTEIEETINYWPIVLWTIYGLGVLFFSVKFFRSLFIIIQQIRNNPKYQYSNFINVLLRENVIPHTFFNYIFLNKLKFENDEIPAEVILHEQTHAIQRHSLDVIFVELLQIVFWFNPLFNFLKTSIKLNHEFLADRAVLNAGAETSEYQKILLAFSSPDSYRDAFSPTLANSINYSSIKKRFTVMKTHTPKRTIWLRMLLLLPLLSILIYSFSSKEIVQKKADKTLELTRLIPKATKAEIAEYNKLAKKYNAVDIENRIIKKKALERMENIYKKMTDEQKANNEPFPECFSPPPPPPPPAPHAPSLTNGNLYMAPEAPPAPNSNPVEYIQELAKKGATFYIGPHKYTADEAIELVQKSENASIDVSNYPIVTLGGC